MYTIKTILAHPSQVQLRIMREVIRAQNLKIDLLAEVLDIEDLYDGILRHAPDLVILPDNMFTACINVITDKCDVVCITENRALSTAGNIRYAYVPVQPPELIQVIQDIYPNLDENKLAERFRARRIFFQSLKLPQGYCATIDAYVQERRRVDRNFMQQSLFFQRRSIIEMIQNEQFPMKRVKERFQSRRFEPSSTFDPYAMQLIEDLGEIVPSNRHDEASLICEKGATSKSLILTPEVDGQSANNQKSQALTSTKFCVNQGSAETSEQKRIPQQKEYRKLARKMIWKIRPTKTIYRRGEPINFWGSIVTIFFADGSSSDYKVTPSMVKQPDMMTPGKKFVTITAKKVHISEPITILDVSLERLCMENAGRSVYSSGEKFDPEGYQFQAVFSDGSVEPITHYHYQRKPLTETQSFIMITYGVVSYPVPVTILTKILQSLQWLSKPQKTQYKRDEPMDLTGGVFIAHYKDGTSEEVTITREMLNVTSTHRLGVRTVLISYHGMTLSFDIEVCNEPWIPLTKQTEDSKAFFDQPIDQSSLDRVKENEEEVQLVSEKYLELLRESRTTYNVGEQVKPSDFLVKLTDKNGNFELINNFTLEPNRPLSENDQFLKIQYQGLELNLPIKVLDKQVLAAVIKTMPKKLEYIKGIEHLDLTNGEIAVFYSDATNESIPMTEQMVESFDGSKIGQQIVYLHFQNQRIPMPVMIRDRILVKVEVLHQPTKHNYTDGERLDLSGLVLEAIYDNGDREQITNYKSEETRVVYGQAVIQMDYKGHLFPVFIHVEESQLQGIRIAKVPDKTEYLENREALDISGGMVAKIFTNGEEKLIPMTLNMVSGFSNQRVGLCRVFVTINNFQSSFEVQIKEKEAVELQVVRRPNKILYFEGEHFDTTGLELKVRYDNNTFSKIQEYTFEPKVVKRDTQEIVFCFQNVSVSLPIQVQVRRVDAISILKMPDKLQYKEGVEQIEAMGGKLLVLYNNGSAETIDMYDSMLCGFDNTIPGRNNVTVVYESKETQYQIDIIPKVLVGIAIHTMPCKTTYQEGEIFNPTGMVLMGYYDNGSSAPLEHFAINPDGPLQKDTSAVMISYADKMTIVPISVINQIHLQADIQDPISMPQKVEREPLETIYTGTHPELTEQPQSPPERIHEPSFCSMPSCKETQEESKESRPTEQETITKTSVSNEIPDFYPSSYNLRFQENSQNQSLFF